MEQGRYLEDLIFRTPVRFHSTGNTLKETLRAMAQKDKGTYLTDVIEWCKTNGIEDHIVTTDTLWFLDEEDALLVYLRFK